MKKLLWGKINNNLRWICKINNNYSNNKNKNNKNHKAKIHNKISSIFFVSFQKMKALISALKEMVNILSVMKFIIKLFENAYIISVNFNNKPENFI